MREGIDKQNVIGYKCNVWQKLSDRSNCLRDVLIWSWNGAPPREGCVVNADVNYAHAKGMPPSP